MAMTAPVASMPVPPNSGSAVTPSTPRSPSLRNNGTFISSRRLYSFATGSTSLSTNPRSISRNIPCSAVGVYSEPAALALDSAWGGTGR